MHAIAVVVCNVVPSFLQSEGASTSDETVGEVSDEEELEDDRLLDLSPRPTPVTSALFPGREENGLVVVDVTHCHMFVVMDYQKEKGRTLACSRVSVWGFGV